MNNPLPLHAYARIVRGLLDARVSKEDVRRLIADNPAHMLRTCYRRASFMVERAVFGTFLKIPPLGS